MSNLTVFYVKDEHFGETKAKTLMPTENYRAVLNIPATMTKEEIFEEAGNNPFDEVTWSKLSNRLQLRSMSVGDLIYDSLYRRVFICEAIGWTVVHLALVDRLDDFEYQIPDNLETM